MRPSKDFLRPLRQVFDALLSYLDTIMQAKHLELTSIVSHFKKNEPKKIAAPNTIFYWNLAREKKRLATPELHHFDMFGVPVKVGRLCNFF